MLRFTAVAAAALALATPAAAQEGQVRVELEAGAAVATRNDVRIPGNIGTLFDLNTLQGEPTSPIFRATIDWQAWERHGFRVSYQYLRTEGTGVLPGPTLFRNAVFSPGVPTQGTYQFDTWRATYRYTLFQSEEVRLYVGATALVRDAEVGLTQPGLPAQRRSDLGLVPLLHFAAEWSPMPGLRLIAEMDGLAAPQGYAIDAALRGAVSLGPQWEATLSYRLLDGGADNSSVYTFATFHAVTAGLAHWF